MESVTTEELIDYFSSTIEITRLNHFLLHIFAGAGYVAIVFMIIYDLHLKFLRIFPNFKMYLAEKILNLLKEYRKGGKE